MSSFLSSVPSNKGIRQSSIDCRRRLSPAHFNSPELLAGPLESSDKWKVLRVYNNCCVSLDFSVSESGVSRFGLSLDIYIFIEKPIPWYLSCMNNPNPFWRIDMPMQNENENAQMPLKEEKSNRFSRRKVGRYPLGVLLSLLLFHTPTNVSSLNG